MDEETANAIVEGTRELREAQVKTPFYIFMLPAQAQRYLGSIGLSFVEGQELYELPDSAIPECTLIVQDTIPEVPGNG